MKLLKLSQSFLRFASDKNPDGEFGYHVTYYKNLNSIAENGLMAQGGRGALGVGGYAGHSQGNLFLTEKSGIDFWYQRMEEMAEHQSDNPYEDELVPMVLRFPWPDNLTWDPAGSEDSRSDAFMTQEFIDPDEIEVYNGNAWIPVEDFDSIDILEAFETEEDEDEETGESTTLYWFANSVFKPNS